MPNTYTELLKTTVGTATSSVTFSLSGISGYTDLVLVANFTVATASGNLVMTFNGDTTSGLYSKTQIEGTGTSAFSGRTANANNIGLDSNMGSDTTSPSIHILNLMNYANTSVFKTVLHRQSSFWSANPGTAARVGLWRNTNAITSITLSNGAVNFNVGSTFSLYGIATQTVPGTAKATGGTITYDDFGRVIHTFTSSGTFTPSEALTVDYLVIAGGGGGSYNEGAGGGAGGYRTSAGTSGANSSAESALDLLTNTNYTVTVGAGGPDTTSGSNSVLATVTSTGGGRGAYNAPGEPGGSGGGGTYGNAGGAGTANQGLAGGSGANSGYYGGGGGGGASSTGGNGSSSNGGNGGNGLASSITGTSVTRAGGGGGGGFRNFGTSGSGGTGGGGNGGAAGGNAGNPGTTNTGSGGGGATWNGSYRGGGSGGSGIVIIRYQG